MDYENSPLITTPWVGYEDIVIAASQILQSSSPAIWSNNSDAPLLIEYLTFDMNSLAFLVRFGLRGSKPVGDKFIHPALLDNVPKMNQAGDNSYPTLNLNPKRPYRVPGSQKVAVRLRDDLAAGARVINVMMSGVTSEGQLTVLSERMSVPSGSTATVYLTAKDYKYVDITSLQLYEESAGSAGDLRNLEVMIEGAGLPQWSRDYVRGSLFFPHRNADGLAYKPEHMMVLMPGDVLDFEFLDSGGSGGTMFVGAIGYRFDRRS